MLMKQAQRIAEQAQQLFGLLQGFLRSPHFLNESELCFDAQVRFGNVPFDHTQMIQLHLTVHGESLSVSPV